MRSAPRSPNSASRPSPPTIVSSSEPPPVKTLCPPPPTRRSFPALPRSSSLPPSPVSLFARASPTRVSPPSPPSRASMEIRRVGVRRRLGAAAIERGEDPRRLVSVARLVAAAAAVQRVVSGPAEQEIVAAPGREHVGAPRGQAGDRVSEERVHPAAAPPQRVGASCRPRAAAWRCAPIERRRCRPGRRGRRRSRCRNRPPASGRSPRPDPWPCSRLRP